MALLVGRGQVSNVSTLVRSVNGRRRARGRGRLNVRVDLPPYPSGLRLAGRRVVVVGGGHVAQRRIPALIAAGADIEVVSPHVTPAIEGMLGSGELRWTERGFTPGDL